MLSVGFEARSDLRQRTERYKMRARNSEATDQGTELTTKCIAPVRQDENLAGTRSSASLDSLVENGDTVKCIPILWKQHDGDAAFNTTPPTGSLADSGWQYEGQWGGVLGTAIAPQYFIAAQHVGGLVGDAFVFQGVTYKTTAYWNDPSSDLRVWKVDSVFPLWAPLYSLSDEPCKSFVVIGRGTKRGEHIVLCQVQTHWSTNVVSLKTVGLTKQQAQKLYPTATFQGSTMTYVPCHVVTNTTLATCTSPVLVPNSVCALVPAYTPNLICWASPVSLT